MTLPDLTDYKLWRCKSLEILFDLPEVGANNQKNLMRKRSVFGRQTKLESLESNLLTLFVAYVG